VLVVDEVGYLVHPVDAANVLFQVVNDRYLKRRPMIFTTNKPIEAWGKVLHDPDLAEAILDRVLERGRVIEMRGSSYRTRHLEGKKIVPQGNRTLLEVNPEGGPGPGERGPSSPSHASGMGVRISGNHQSEYLEPALRKDAT
jgi:hypothetical protein